MSPLIKKQGESVKQRFISFLPLILIEIYLGITLLLYQFGPYPWPTNQKTLFWILIALYHLAFILGYCFQMKTTYVERSTVSLDTFLLKAVKILLIINLLISLITVVRDFSMSSISISGIIERFKFGIQDPSAAYKYKVSTVNDAAYGGKIMTFFLLATSFVPALTIPVGCVFFKKLGIGYKLLLGANILLEIVHYVGIGTNIGIFTVCLTVVIILAVTYLAKIYRQKVNQNRLMIIIAVLMVLVIVFLLFFNTTIGSRLEGDKWLDYSVGGIYPTEDCALFNYIPKSLQKTAAMITMYTTQGYYAMSLALDLPWYPMFGLGGASFVQQYADKIINISQYSYNERLAAFGWHPTVNWHSLYLWIANDISFFGVIIYMLLFGFFFAYFYRVSLRSKNCLAIAIFVSLCIMAFFIPANNQIFGFLVSFAKFIFLIVFYIVYLKTSKKPAK